MVDIISNKFKANIMTSYGLETYKAHDLNIYMRTSSGDEISLDLSNHTSSSLLYNKDAKNSSTQMSYSSMQSFSFSVDSNGIDAQDKKEIEEFMKVAKPYIDNFLQELSEDAPKSPINELAHKVASIFNPEKERDENSSNNIKNNIVKMFEDSMKRLEIPERSDKESMLEKIFKDTQKLLKKTLEEFDNFNKNIYA
jgi:hypothetical protein